MSNSIDPDETTHYELSHLDLPCLQKPYIIAYGSDELRVKCGKEFKVPVYLELIS